MKHRRIPGTRLDGMTVLDAATRTVRSTVTQQVFPSSRKQSVPQIGLPGMPFNHTWSDATRLVLEVAPCQ